MPTGNLYIDMAISEFERAGAEVAGLVLHRSGRLDDRTYYYSAEPYRILVVLRNGLALDGINWGATVDVAVGGDSGKKYVAEHNEGKTHTKITIFHVLDGGSDKTAMSLSALISKAPKNPGRPQIGRTPTKPRTITLTGEQWRQAAIDGDGNASGGIRAWHAFRQRHARLFDHEREQGRGESEPTKPPQSRPTRIIVRPVETITATIAWLTIDAHTIRILFPEKRDDFRAVVKRLGYVWDNPYWRREFNAKLSAETILYRAAEVAHHLLAAGFCVAPPTVAVRELALSADYEPEPHRMIKVLQDGSCAGWFAIRWPYEDDLYKEASSLPAARYAKPYVAVPPEHFAAVLDFAEVYQFTLSDAARELAAQAQALEASALIAVNLPPVTEAPTVDWQRPDLDDTDTYGIDDELLDTD